MSEVDLGGTVSVVEAAEMLGMTGGESHHVVLRRKLGTVEAPSGRRVVPFEVIEARTREHQTVDGSG